MNAEMMEIKPSLHTVLNFLAYLHQNLHELRIDERILDIFFAAALKRLRLDLNRLTVPAH